MSRLLLAAALVLASVSQVAAQSSGPPWRIGYLAGNRQSLPHDEFERGLRELGYRPGATVEIVYRWYEGSGARARELAAELARERVDVIVVVGPQGGAAGRDVIKGIPVVFTHMPDPVRNGMVQSLARPGGNMTGLAFDPTPDIVGKMLGLLAELVPRMSRFGLVWNPSAPGAPAYVESAHDAARARRLSVHPAPVQTVNDFDAAVASMAQARCDGAVVVQDPVTVIHRRRLIALAAEHRLPMMYLFRQTVDDGGLMSYGPSAGEQFRRAATFVDRILKGAKPSTLPVEQPTTFEFALNRKTAAALGLVVPPSLLLRADHVVD